MARTLYGAVNTNGSIHNSGSGGFSSRREGNGQYLIDFDSRFGKSPVVVATPIGRTPGGAQSDNVINVEITRDNCTIWMFDVPEGNRQNGAFTFIVMGN